MVKFALLNNSKRYMPAGTSAPGRFMAHWTRARAEDLPYHSQLEDRCRASQLTTGKILFTETMNTQGSVKALCVRHKEVRRQVTVSVGS